MELQFLVSYVALLALMLVALSYLVVSERRRLGRPYGHGDSQSLARRIAAHNNFCQYVPFCIILLFLQYAGEVSTVLLHAQALTLLVARGMHAYGMVYVEGRVKPSLAPRIIGTALTFLILLVAAFTLLVQVLR